MHEKVYVRALVEYVNTTVSFLCHVTNMTFALSQKRGERDNLHHINARYRQLNLFSPTVRVSSCEVLKRFRINLLLISYSKYLNIFVCFFKFWLIFVLGTTQSIQWAARCFLLC
jgi:hypothetical protein